MCIRDRYKYPSFWCSVQTLYGSLQNEDRSTGMSRGFYLLTRDFHHYAEICRVSDDLVSSKNTIADLHNPNCFRKRFMQHVHEGMKPLESALISLSEDFRILLIYYLFDFANRAECQHSIHDPPIGAEEGHTYLQDLTSEISHLPVYQVAKSIVDRSSIENSDIIQILKNFVEDQAPLIISLLAISLRHYVPEIYPLCGNADELLLHSRRSNTLNEISKMNRLLCLDYKHSPRKQEAASKRLTDSSQQ
eukprot:TRINITY_DN4153_c0_g2_i6.p1 TRINITY_DN4153_c0_g2~~TRINITY_DN4153_c0_g2_i6.p1  ORF type:complete len:270 (-),score=53.35 TRINITY_DN4153_c0_g2_i6:88-831(-)